MYDSCKIWNCGGYTLVRLCGSKKYHSNGSRDHNLKTGLHNTVPFPIFAFASPELTH